MVRDQLAVDDVVIWKSRFTGNETRVIYRGELNGDAMVWTGMLQVVVPFADIVRRAEE